jgi:hypothetical protein
MNWIGSQSTCSQHVEADGGEADEEEEDRRHAEEAEVDRPDLRVAEPAEQLDVERRTDALAGVAVARQRDARVARRVRLHLGEEVLVFRHLARPGAQDQIGRLSHHSHHSGHPRVQKGPLMTMQTALKNTGAEGEEQPQTVDAQRADGVADGVAEEGVLVLRRLHRARPVPGWWPTGPAQPCSGQRQGMWRRTG